jgi:hypothetical protein
VGEDVTRRDAAAVETLEPVLFGGRQAQNVPVEI